MVIIGVIAAITVPSLMQKTGNKENAAKVKKAYSVLQNSIHKIALDKGYAQGDYSFVTDTNAFFDSFEKTVNTQKRCKDSDECIPWRTHQLNGSEDGINGHTNAVITTDGMIYTYNYSYGNIDYWGVPEEDADKYMGRFWVDVNGSKKPQVFGKDLFAFVLIQGKGILPAGYGNNSANCKRDNSGFDCTAKVLKEGDINY